MFKRSKIKPAKKQVIENYTMSYLDRKSKSYHKVVMTAFTGVFGLAGAAYIFSSNAATPGVEGAKNSNASLVLIAFGLAIAAAVLITTLVVMSKSHRK